MPIESATAGDLAAIVALLNAAKLPTDDLTPALIDGFVLLRDHGSVVGVGGIEWNEGSGLLRSVTVATTHERAGLGGQIVDALEARARARGTEALYLLTTTAEPYFASRGYTRAARDAAPAGIRRTAQFAGLCPASSAFMLKVLGN